MIANNVDTNRSKNVRVVLVFTGGKIVTTPKLGQGVDFTDHTVILSKSSYSIDLSMDDTFIDNPASDRDSSNSGEAVFNQGNMMGGSCGHAEKCYEKKSPAYAMSKMAKVWGSFEKHRPTIILNFITFNHIYFYSY